MLKKIKKTLTDSCILFTVFVFILLIVYSLVYSPDDGIVSGLSLETSLLLFVCSILLRAFHNVLYIDKMRLGLRVLIHYLLVVGTAFGALMLIREVTGASKGQSPIVVFVILSLFSLIYIGFCIIFLWQKKRKAEKENSKKEYSSIVKK